MVIYIPNHLKSSIPILKTLSDMVVEYNKSYSKKSLDSFEDYYLHYSINTIKSFIELSLGSQEKSISKDNNREDVINYLVKLFYSVKGTPKIFEYMEKYLGIKFKGGIDNIRYTVNEVIFDIDEISVDDIQTYIDSLKNFLSSLLYYGDLITEISKINLTIKDTINVSVITDIQKYKEYIITDIFNIEK